MKVRAVKIRALVMLPIIAAAGIGLSACDSKAGDAADIYGQKLSETDLNDYVQEGAEPITNSDGTQTAPKTLVLEILIQTEAFERLLAEKGVTPTPADLEKAKTTVLAGNPEQALTDQVTKAGLEPKFEQNLIYNQELSAIITQTYGSDQAGLNAALKKISTGISVSPRYGSWDPTKLALTELGKAQLPGVVTIDATLPGDVSPPPTAAP